VFVFVDELHQIFKIGHLQEIHCSDLTGLPTDYDVRFEDGLIERVEQCELLEYNKDRKLVERNNGSSSSPGIKASKPSMHKHTNESLGNFVFVGADDFEEAADLLPPNEEPRRPVDESSGGLSWSAYRSTNTLSPPPPLPPPLLLLSPPPLHHYHRCTAAASIVPSTTTAAASIVPSTTTTSLLLLSPPPPPPPLLLYCPLHHYHTTYHRCCFYRPL
jgi:hypothetical protein